MWWAEASPHFLLTPRGGAGAWFSASRHLKMADQSLQGRSGRWLSFGSWPDPWFPPARPSLQEPCFPACPGGDVAGPDQQLRQKVVLMMGS